jgi:lipooligosaccharide transport system permease protein
MLVAIVFGLDPSWGMLLVPFIAALGGFGWASFGIFVAGQLDSIENFNYIISAVLTPLFLVAGTFFPISGLPEWAQVLAELNPLYHLVELVRDAVFMELGWIDLAHLGVIVGFGLIMWRLAVWRMEKRLIE